MADYDTSVQIVDGGRRGRKVKLTKRKKKTYSDDGQEPKISCSHGLFEENVDLKHKRSLCRMADLSQNDMVCFRKRFYSNRTKALQDCFILKYIQATKPVRRTALKNPKNQRTVSIIYYVKTEKGEDVPICAATFRSILNISRDRIQRLAKNYKLSEAVPNEKRGGLRLPEKHEEMTKNIKKSILKYKCRESHYSRKNSSRSYLPPELNIKKMWQRFCNECDRDGILKPSLSKYKSVFYKHFNLGFGNPRSDTCSMCAQYAIKIKAATNLEEKNRFRVQYKLHKIKAKKFFEILKEKNENTLTVCFDCQQNQPLPKLSIGEVFYSRQVWLYNCLFMQVSDKDKNSDVTHYSWFETQSGRGANEIASALKHYIAILENDLKKTKRQVVLRLFSDSCGSQNKNFALMATLMRISEKSNVFTKIQHFYPIRGHSYMPPDRVFGNIEKEYRAMETITVPSEYYKVLSKFGKCLVLGKDWNLYDIKSKASEVVKKKLPFKMQEVRVLEYTNKSISVRTTYSGTSIEVEPLRKGIKNLHHLDRAEKITLKNHVSEKKAQDVKKLMDYFDTSSEEAQTFYKSVFENCQGHESDNIQSVYYEEESVLE